MPSFENAIFPMAESDTPDLGDEPGLGLALPPAPEPYRVLARKYRPQNFTGLIGQDALVQTLRNAFASGRIAHAFMLTGVRGVGKTTTARIIARALNCIGPDGKRTTPTIDPCGVCDPCRSIAEGRNVDVLELDAASNNGINEIREITDGVRYAPASSRYKVYILDEVHMLSKPAFNALLKTLEEPPPHVEFIFATTEMRKVPVTVLSRCQRFDLRRVETETLSHYLSDIAARENVAIEPAALSLIARAAEGSVRDGLSLLDQAIAHGEMPSNEKTAVTGEAIRAMLGLADRGRVLDLFEKLMGTKIAEALADLRELYDRGADPLVVMQDLLETTHFLTRVKVAPGAEGFFDGGSAEAARAVTMAGKLTVASLSRAWQMLLKGLLEVRDAANPLAAAEMALIRLAYAAELPPTERLVRELLESQEGGGKPSSSTPVPGLSPRSQAVPLQAVASQPAPRAVSEPTLHAAQQPATASAPKVEIATLEDIVRLAKENGALQLATQLDINVRLISLERGRIEFSPAGRPPPTLPNMLAQRLRDWTGERWIVTLANEGGAPTLSESRANAERAKKESVANEPFVRAVLDAFPGAEIVKVHDREDIPASELPVEAVPDKDED
jgi:DNA polymerase-3 subunit gamma/tau